MSRHDVAVLTLRAFALYAWFQALGFLTGAAFSIVLSAAYKLDGGFTVARALTLFSPALANFLVGSFLFVRSRELASWLLPLPSEEVAEQLPPHPLPMASVAFAVTGVAVFLYAMPPVLTFAISFAPIEDANVRAQYLSREAPQIVATVVQLVLGLLLFLNSRTFATSWWSKQQPKPRE